MDIEAYRDKESFGDLDIIIDSSKLPSDYITKIENYFHPKQMVKNGGCVSFEYKEFQIDLIITKLEEYETSLNYFAFNDLGNLIGRVAHTMGLKFGHDGLSYNWKIDTYQFKNVVLVTSMEHILEVLGYDAQRYFKGFDTLEDIFNFAVSSPFFNKAIYQLNNRNHAARIRDKKRKTYMDFLKWIENYEETEDQKHYAKYHENSKDVWLPYLFESIPGFHGTYHEVNAEWEYARQFKKRFNGDLVREWTGLDGKALGDFMKGFKDDPDGLWHEFVLRHDQDAVKEYTISLYKERYGLVWRK